MITSLSAFGQSGIDEIMYFMFDLAGMGVYLPGKFSINKSLSKKDVVKEYMRISNRVNKVFKVDRPSEMIRFPAIITNGPDVKEVRLWRIWTQ